MKRIITTIKNKLNRRSTLGAKGKGRSIWDDILDFFYPHRMN